MAYHLPTGKSLVRKFAAISLELALMLKYETPKTYFNYILNRPGIACFKCVS